MGIDRRGFIKIAGITALGAAAGRPIANAVSKEDVASISQLPNALTAKRWAMVIDLKKCAERGDCTKCIDACHSIHNVPDFGNPKDEVKWIWKESFENAFEEFEEQELEFVPEDLKLNKVPVFCNHCDNPPCVKVCPTQSTWKRDDGIVMMDYHRCIGCRYCMAACPYGSRSFNWRDPRPFIKNVNPEFPTRMRGVVEKCDLCAERLAKGLMPACVEACEAKAMVFGDLEDSNSAVREILRNRFAIRRKPELGTNPQIYYLV